MVTAAAPPESPLSGGGASSSQREARESSYLSGIDAVRPTPSVQPPVDLYAPITSDVILEVRSGKMKPLEGLKVLSGIDKGLLTGRVKVSSMGIIGDEHDYTFHGGVDKAVHGYCSAHYDNWRREFPAAADRFRPGGFGENLVFARLNERNIHIGDVFAVGPPGSSDDDCLLLQVSLPRQPCFKLNHRFNLRDFAPNTWKTSRTGWYYRVLREGTVQAGDETRLVRRPHPDWPLERVQEFLHRRPGEMARVAELAAVDEFGAECKNAFRSRLAKHEARERKLKRLAEGASDEKWRQFRVVEKRRETPRIASFVFEAVEKDDHTDAEEGQLDPGAHVQLRLGKEDGDGGGGLLLLTRSYSMVSGDRNRFELGVAYDPQLSRGGSRFLHEAVDVGSVVRAGRFLSGVPLVMSASHYVFVAGGVGVTAFLHQIEALTGIHYSCVLHYGVRSADEVAFAARLAKLGGDVVKIYDKSKGQRVDVAQIVRTLPWNSRISFCGPRRLMEEALRETRAAGVPEADVHFEAFEADTSGDPFDVVVANRSAVAKGSANGTENGDKNSNTNENGAAGGAAKKEEGVGLHVDADETLLEVLQREFGTDAVPSSCEVGNCATCKVRVKDGRIEHRGTALTEEEKAAGDAMLSCVSRGIGRIVIEV